MPKIKTNRGAAKRFQRTKTGKFKRSMAFRRHLLGHKSSKRKRRLRMGEYVDPANAKEIRRLLPYS